MFPDEALPYLAADKLDRRLFDVTVAARAGLRRPAQRRDPAHREPRRPAAATVRQRRGPAGTHGCGSCPASTAPPCGRRRSGPATPGGRSRRPTRRDAWAPRPAARSGRHRQALARRPGAGHLARAWRQIGAPAALGGRPRRHRRRRSRCSTPASTLDHPDLAGQVDDTASFVPGETIDDGNGHGTHVASTIAGTGAASGGDEKGVAPGADLLVGKVLGDDGFGAGLLGHRRHGVGRRPGADVVSMSLGDSRAERRHRPDEPGASTRSRAQTGALFVIAAGNTGPEASSARPGAADAALTVGAVDNAGPARLLLHARARASATTALKPDIAAPGVDILAARGRTATTARRLLPDHERHVDGDAARRRRRGDPGPAAPGLDRPASSRTR